MVPIKRRLNSKPIGVKCKALKDLEKGITNKDAAAKSSVQKNTLSTWLKNEHKLTTSLEKKGMWQKSTRCESYDQINKAVFHWFLGKRNQKVSIDGIILKEKALEFAKTLGIKEFKALDCWLSKWKKSYKYNNSILFSPFCTTLNIFTKNFHHFFGPEIFNLQETCILSPSPRLTSLPVMTASHSASWSALRK